MSGNTQMIVLVNALAVLQHAVAEIAGQAGIYSEWLAAKVGDSGHVLTFFFPELKEGQVWENARGEKCLLIHSTDGIGCIALKSTHADNPPTPMLMKYVNEELREMLIKGGFICTEAQP